MLICFFVISSKKVMIDSCFLRNSYDFDNFILNSRYVQFVPVML